MPNIIENNTALDFEELSDLLTCRSGLPSYALEALAEYAEIGLYNLYLPTREIELNRTITRFTGYEPGELPHNENTKMLLTYEADYEVVQNAMDSLMNGKANRYYIEYRMKRKDGSTISIGESALVIERDENGVPIHICALCRDLSRLRQTEENVRRMGKENAILARSIGYKEITDRNRMLSASIMAAAVIIGGYHQNYETVLRQALQVLAESVGADGAFILRNTMLGEKLEFYPRVLWSKDIIANSDSSLAAIAYDDIFPNWQNLFNEDFSIRSHVADLPKGLRGLPFISNAISIMLVPIYIHGEFFGLLGFETCAIPRLFTEDEADILRMGSQPIASSIMRNEIFLRLNEDKEAAISDTKAKTEFLSNMSHEIRTPINAIIGMTTLARKNNDPENIDYYLGMIAKSSKQLLRLVNDVLDMSKIDEGKLEILNEPFDFEEMLAGISSMINVKTAEKNLKFLTIINADFSHEVIGDSLRLSQVLINLLGNAAKFTPDGGTVTLSIEEKKIPQKDGSNDPVHWLHFVVSDTGIGITPEQQKTLFQIFSQADKTITRNYGGSGLGLSICKRLISLMGGDIWVESEKGKGSDFIFDIPIKYGDKLSSAESIKNMDLFKNYTQNWQGRTILLAEDIEVNREIIIGMLEGTGVEIVKAEDGEKALALFQNSPDKFDLILMDIQMPNMDGLTATNLIRKINTPKAASIPILAMTANAFKEDIDACIAAGMNVHIAKPIDMNELIHTISQYLP